MLGYKALKHGTTGELCLFCEYGEVWQYDANTYSFMVNSPYIAHKIGKVVGVELPHLRLDDETVINVPAHLAPTLIKKLIPSKQDKKQLLIAYNEYE